MARKLMHWFALPILPAFVSVAIAWSPRPALAAAQEQQPPEKTADSGKKTADSGKKKKQKELTTKEARLDFIRKAQVWAPTNVAAMDLRAGPQGSDAFQPNEMVTC